MYRHASSRLTGLLPAFQGWRLSEVPPPPGGPRPPTYQHPRGHPGPEWRAPRTDDHSDIRSQLSP